jgi:hypothetical protein
MRVAEGISTRQFYVQDLVRPRKVQRGLGVKYGAVQRTHHDVDSHIPHPQTEYNEEISRGKGVGRALFNRFLHDGIPPKDTVLVQWLPFTSEDSPVSCELAAVKDLQLLDRSFLLGDTVKRSSESAMSGTVVDMHVHCDLVQFGWDPLGRRGQSLTDVPGEELSPAAKFRETAMVVYHGWVGRVEVVERELAVQLSNRTVVVISESEDMYSMLPDSVAGGPEVGELIKTKKGVLRRGRWVFGSYNPNVEPAGQIVESRPTHVTVRWLFQRPHGTRHPQPPDVLDTDVLDSGDVVVYDRYVWYSSICVASADQKQKPETGRHLQVVSRFCYRRLGPLQGFGWRRCQVRRISHWPTRYADRQVYTLCAQRSQRLRFEYSACPCDPHRYYGPVAGPLDRNVCSQAGDSELIG